MAENEIIQRQKGALWRAGLPKDAVPKYELDFIMKLSGLERSEAMALLRRHRWDREALFAELASSTRRAWG